MSSKYVVVYNTATAPVVLDEELGTQLLPQEFAPAQRSKVQDHITNGSLVIVDPDSIGDEAMVGAKAAKDSHARLTKEWEDEKAAKAEADSKSMPADYDVSDSKQTSGSKSASSKKN